MKTSTITTLSGYQKVLENAPIYMSRGVSDSKYKLIPKVARDWHLPLDLLKLHEEWMLSDFKIRATPFLDTVPVNDWEWLAIAQHYGLPTRLLDWTLNPLVSLYFACKENELSDGVVYLGECLDEFKTNDITSPFDVTETRKWSSHYINARLASQDGLFTLSENPLKEHTLGVLCKIIIKAQAKKSLLSTLSNFGVHSATVFPGLEGVAHYVKDRHKAFYGKDASTIIHSHETYEKMVKEYKEG